MKRKLLMLGIGVVLIAVSIFCLNAVIVGNQPYSPITGPVGARVCDMITDGASELLQSAADAFLFLNEVELAEKNGMNFSFGLQKIDMAAERVQRTMNFFREIIATGSMGDYEKQRSVKLRNFSYDQFARENGLSEETMREVSAYLGEGNMLGFYARHIRNLQILSGMLQGIRSDLLAQKVPENKVLWSLLQQYNATLMFGNYASMVFYKI